jgi:hypothetical protein
MSDALAGSTGRRTARAVANRVRHPIQTNRENNIIRTHEGFTLEEQAYWKSRIISLMDRGSREPEQWAQEVELTFRQHRLFASLVRQLADARRAVDSASEAKRRSARQQLDSRVENALEVARRFVESQPITSLDYGVRARISEAVYEVLRKVARIIMPPILVLIFGGTFYGAWQFEGLVAAAKQKSNEAVAAMQKDVEAFNSVRIDATNAEKEMSDEQNKLKETNQSTMSKISQLSQQASANQQSISDSMQNVKLLQAQIVDLNKKLAQTEVLVNARRQLDEAIAKINPQTREKTWELALKIAVWQDITMIGNLVVSVIAVIVALIALRRRGRARANP